MKEHCNDITHNRACLGLIAKAYMKGIILYLGHFLCYIISYHLFPVYLWLPSKRMNAAGLCGRQRLQRVQVLLMETRTGMFAM